MPDPEASLLAAEVENTNAMKRALALIEVLRARVLELEQNATNTGVAIIAARIMARAALTNAAVEALETPATPAKDAIGTTPLSGVAE